jgi:hypothetical protein
MVAVVIVAVCVGMALGVKTLNNINIVVFRYLNKEVVDVQ